MFPIFVLLRCSFVSVVAKRDYEFCRTPIVQDVIRTDVQDFGYEISHRVVYIEFSMMVFDDLTDRFIFFYALPSDYPKKRSDSFTTDGLFITIFTAFSNTFSGSIHSISSGGIRSTAPTSSYVASLISWFIV